VSVPRILEAGDSALLLELDTRIDPAVNARAVAMAAAIRREQLPGVRDVVPTYRSVAVYFDPLTIPSDRIRASLETAMHAPAVITEGRLIEVPVAYGGEAGPDLAEVAVWSGLTPASVVDRHREPLYRVFMLGFLPGFAYLGPVDERIAAPRRATPRLRVAAGSVGVAGRQTGIYPRESPGGWNIIGRSSIRVFDPLRTPAALFAPGDRVRFVSAGPGGEGAHPPEEITRESSSGDVPNAARTVTVLRPGMFTTVQDAGRWGHQSSGVPVGGALDQVSHRAANAAVGNPTECATLEATMTGPELRLDHDVQLAVAGADLSASLDGREFPVGAAVSGRAGTVLRFGERRSGARAYVAFDGGIDVVPVLGSRATHVGACLGGVRGRALAAGDRLPLPRRTRAGAGRGLSMPTLSGGAKLRFLPGPQHDAFTGEAFRLLESTRFTVTPQSNRMGYRLSGARLPRVASEEMISDAAFTGGIQVPSSGDPILLMHDRQTTGGYPQIGTVITADLPLAGQLMPGDWIEFERCTMAEALQALSTQEAMLRALA
jgi:KipI family sensor histidine kinase inhibitor